VLPSLVAEDLRASLRSFLGTTFALGGDAMLLLRLGVALGVTTDERPLGAITPVATSATAIGDPPRSEAFRGHGHYWRDPRTPLNNSDAAE
jgi:hypothetical protein